MRLESIIRQNALWVTLVCICVMGIANFYRRPHIGDFYSDGCSLFPDRSIINEDDWCDCCFEHDIAYWKGGTEEERLAADMALRDCILEKTGNEELAQIMFEGVRFGGSPYFYIWYRWGYGWSFDRKYKALSDREQELVTKKLETYFAINPRHPCSE